MFNLNKIIYSLLMVFFLEFSLFAMYFSMSGSFNKVESLPQVQVLKIEVAPKILKTESSIVILKEKIFKKLRKENKKTLKNVLLHVSPNTKSDILIIKNQMVKPVIYTKSIKLSTMSIENKKKTFINMIIPSILVAKHRIEQERKRVLALLSHEHISKKDALWLTKKRYFFKAATIDELYNKMELHPTSIVIAQAIIESGWGTSRFFEKANNVFGIWSFNKHEERIAASEKRGDKTIYLKKYKDVEQSIADYFLMLSTKDAYKEFREKRLESQDPFVLIEQLGKYSELGDIYIENLKNTIKKNNLLAYDSYSLDI
jgi:Bax protein